MKLLNQIFQALLGVVALIIMAILAAGRLAWRKIGNWWKKRSKWMRIVIATILILLLVGFISLKIYIFYNFKCDRTYCNRRLSENIVLCASSRNVWRVYDCTKGEFTTGKINWMSEVSENDSIAVYALSKKRGYINVNTGRIIIDAEANDYNKAWVFSEGLAAVMKDGKIGFINSANEVIIPFKFDYSSRQSMWEFGYVFHNGFCAMANSNGNMGLIDKSGNWVVEPTYDEIRIVHKSGYRVIVKDNKCGILDASCAVAYPAEYEDISVIPDGFVLAKDGKKWQEDFEGNIVRKFMFDATYYLNYPIGYNESGNIQYGFADYAKYEVMNRYGIMNRITGEPITLALYSDINMLSKDVFEVQDSESYDWYLLDTKGNIIKK